LKKSLPTEAGQSSPGKPAKKHSTELIDAVNQVYALLKINFHNQFYKAYSTTDDLNSARRLWVDALKRFEPHTILMGAKSIIESSEYLPTLRTMIRHCEEFNNSELPGAHAAYIEACRAPSPKADQPWSHLAVYYAGKAADWYFLQSSTEQQAFPVFKAEYDKICQKVHRGEVLAPPKVLELTTAPETPMTKEDKFIHLESLKNTLDL
jgi:hypothetical protein